MSAITQNSQQGFTLLELLLAMVLSVIVITAMSAVFKSVVDSSAAIDSEVSLNQEGRVLLSIFQKDLSSVVLNNSTAESPDSLRLQFRASTGIIPTGDAFMSFPSSNELYALNPTGCPLNYITYSIEDTDNGLYSLVRTSRKFAHLSGSWKTERIRLSKRLTDIRLEFNPPVGSFTVGTKEFLRAKSLKIEFTLKEKEKERHYMTFLALHPAIFSISPKTK